MINWKWLILHSYKLIQSSLQYAGRSIVLHTCEKIFQRSMISFFAGCNKNKASIWDNLERNMIRSIGTQFPHTFKSLPNSYRKKYDAHTCAWQIMSNVSYWARTDTLKIGLLICVVVNHIDSQAMHSTQTESIKRNKQNENKIIQVWPYIYIVGTV